ncbi:MAG: anthranilate synthase component I [Rickettsiales bacterium]|nr:anthranilate synthase component I [Rickettsiales bacterium]
MKTSPDSDFYFPSLKECTLQLQQGLHQLVWTTRVADTETPISAMLKLMTPNEPIFLLESVEGGEVRGRYSIIGLYPDMVWRCHGAVAEIARRDGQLMGDFLPQSQPALASLNHVLDAIRMEIPSELPPMAAGLIGYHGYDMIRQVENLPIRTPDTIGLPDACLMRPSVMLVFDAVDGVIFFITPIWANENSLAPDEAYHNAQMRLHQVITALDTPLPTGAASQMGLPQPVAFTANMSQADYHQMVERAKEYIRAGDIFQVVPSQRFTASFEHHPFALYRSLRHMNPSPFLFYLSMGDFALVGSSPEILVRLRDDTVTIRPIAGTRKRGRTREEDTQLATELLADPKEVAEHLMLLDLGRNDVGRCSLPGTVRVTERMVIERYSHVMHIVSNVEGTHDPQKNSFDCMMSGFPAGTVSGAPKIRAMEIIDTLEPERRSFYGGSVGYFSANGAMDTCITLRTGLVKDGMLYLQAGGGVVADSHPEEEYQETVNKARALVRAAEQAHLFTGGIA